MSLDPLLKPMIDAYNSAPQPSWTDAADRKQQAASRPAQDNPYAGYALPAPEVEAVWEEKIEVTDPPGTIIIRVYQPGQGTTGALVHLHGGGWWSGGLDDVDTRCRVMASRAGIVVVSAGYRLAPEFPFPTGLHDARAALRWTITNAASLGIDPGRLGVGGESAGANLAAALALLARNSGESPLCLQLLEIPALDLTLSSPSVKEFGEGYVLTEKDLHWCAEQYLAGGDPGDPLASPLAATDLSGLPAAVIASAGCDPLRDDASRYAARLAEAGTSVALTCYPGMVHGAHILTALLPTARTWEEDMVTAVRAHLAGDDHAT